MRFTLVERLLYHVAEDLGLKWLGSIPAPTGEPRLRASSLGSHRRSIPAPAGEPGRCASANQPRRVYPRAYGGAYWGRDPARRRLTVYPRAYGGARSVVDLRVDWLRGVYPRAYGGATRTPSSLAGSSPFWRSIPAPTGEPHTKVPGPARGRWIMSLPVYPRAYGGAYCTS